jgi:hypothetical protein
MSNIAERIKAATPPGWRPGDGWAAWAEAAAALARDERLDQLRAVIVGRLAADGLGAGPGFASPPLEDEDESPDAVLVNACRRLENAAENGDEAAAAGLRRLRREIVGLLLENFPPQGDAALFDRLGWLAGRCGVRREPALSAAAADAMWGALTRRLGPDVAVWPHVADPHDADLMDLWLAFVAVDYRPHDGMPRESLHPWLQALLRGWSGLRETEQQKRRLDDRREALWTALLFRALMRLSPYDAAARALPRLSDLVAPGGARKSATGREAMNLLADFADRFDADEALAAIFMPGVDRRESSHALEVWRSFYEDDDMPDWLKTLQENVVVNLDAYRRPLHPVDRPPRSAGKIAL